MSEEEKSEITGAKEEKEASNKSSGEGKTEKKWVFTGRNKSTGVPYFERKKVKKPKLEEPPGVDELGIPGVEGPLLKEPPNNIGGVTVEDLEKDRKSSKIISHAEQSLPEKDKD